MTRSRHLIVASLLAIASGLLFFSSAHAQEKSLLRGRVITAGNEPVPSLTVSLHRVVGRDGDVIGQGLSDAEGWFEIPIPADSSGTEGVYFAATQFEGEMYIGQPFRPPVPQDAGYPIIVGPGGVSASVATGEAEAQAGAAAPAQRDISPRAVLLILAAVALVLAIVVLFVRRGIPADRGRRRALLDLAILEEQFAAGGLDEAERTKLETRRAEMRRRLTAPALRH